MATKKKVTDLKEQLAASQDREREKDLEIDRLQSVLNTPETEDFFAGIKLEAAHQRERWGPITTQERVMQIGSD